MAAIICLQKVTLIYVQKWNPMELLRIALYFLLHNIHYINNATTHDHTWQASYYYLSMNNTSHSYLYSYNSTYEYMYIKHAWLNQLNHEIMRSAEIQFHIAICFWCSIATHPKIHPPRFHMLLRHLPLRQGRLMKKNAIWAMKHIPIPSHYTSRVVYCWYGY